MTLSHPTGPATGGTRLGSYRLLTRIGEGGMGVVHLAEDAQGRRVALKVLRPHVVGDDEARRRLAREVASLREVHSRHVAEILDADPFGETPYLVTRYVPGLSLYSHVEHQGPVPQVDLLHVAHELLLALRDVHAAGVLHRDVKPSNVLMEGRAPVLIDFGLARMAEDPRLTVTGWMLGTPGYLAPEVLWGDDPTPACDVFAWAATLTYAATGTGPFGRGHTMTVLDRTRRGEADLRQVPAALRPVLADALAPDPLDRPTLAEALVALGGAAAAAGPTVHVPLPPAPAPPVAPDPVPAPQVTLPWQVAAAPAAVPSTPVNPPTRPYTVVAPAPVPVAPVPATAGTPPRPVLPPPAPTPQTAGRLRARLLALGLATVLVVAFTRRPIDTFLVLAVGVLLLRGQSRAADNGWMRRLRRGGRKWYDAPLTVVSYPWQTLLGSGGAVILLAFAGLGAGLTVAGSELLGAPRPWALVAGGVVLALLTWLGPAAARVRRPVRRVTAAVGRSAWTGWAALAALVLVAGGLALTTPADASSREQPGILAPLTR